MKAYSNSYKCACKRCMMWFYFEVRDAIFFMAYEGITWYNGVNLLCWGCVQRYIWVFPKISILIGISIINRPFWGPPIFGNTHIYIYYITLLCRELMIYVPHFQEIYPAKNMLNLETSVRVNTLMHISAVLCKICSCIFLGPKISQLKHTHFTKR